jgi:hexosaminidase
MKNVFLIASITMLFNLLSCEKETAPIVSVIPHPLQLVQTGGVFSLTPKVKIVVNGDAGLSSEAAFLKKRILASTGYDLDISGSGSGRAIRMQVDAGLEGSLGTEGYSLSVTRKGIDISGATPAGVFYGIQTLLQLLPPEIYSDQVTQGIEWIVPCVKITDKPRFAWRGFLLDVSRHFFPASYIYEVLDHMALHKLNRFQMHLTDDQGWRVEIKKYPKLTGVGAWRVDREDRHWNSREAQKPGEKATYGGFYTQDDIRKFVAYAAERNIVIVPEIEMPAHSTAALAAYPEYSCTGHLLTVLPGGIWPCDNIFCAGKEDTYSFLEDVLAEVIELFPSEYIHIGGDEADKSQWVACKDCQRTIQMNGLRDEKGLQSYFIQRIEKFLNSKGRQLIGWDEILEGGLAPNAAVMSWRGTEGGIAAAKSGHPVVMTPTSHCYFDYYQGNPETEPLAIGGYLPLEKVYSFDPVPEGLTADEAKMILGAQANLWTEYIGDPSHANYMTFPRLTALAELAWSSPGQKDFDRFSLRLIQQLKRLDAMGINYSMTFSSVTITPGYNQERNQVEVSLKSGFPGTEIRYSMDGTDPRQSALIYSAPLLLDKTAVVKAAAFLDGKPLSPVAERQITVHLATGKTVVQETPFAAEYTGGGAFGLVNGIRGTINLSDGSWQGFKGTDMTATIDLGSVQTVGKITVGALQSIGSWVFLPTRVEFLTAAGEGNFLPAGEVKNTVDQRDGNRQVRNFTLEIPPAQARYIRVIARSVGTCPPWHAGKGEPAWLFIDEIIVE